MLALFTALLDRCIQLSREHGANNRKWFEDFVDPLHAAFHEIHTNYLRTFVGSRKLLRECGGNVEAEYAKLRTKVLK